MDGRQRDIIELGMSCLTYVVSCNFMASLVDPDEERRKMYGKSNYREISFEHAEKALKMLAATAGVTPDHPYFPYTIERVEGNIINLRRLRPSHCKVCDRVHESQHPYMIVVNNRVYWYCRRHAQNKNLYIGNLEVEQLEQQTNGQVQEFEDEEPTGPGELIDPDAPVLVTSPAAAAPPIEPLPDLSKFKSSIFNVHDEVLMLTAEKNNDYDRRQSDKIMKKEMTVHRVSTHNYQNLERPTVIGQIP